MVAAAGFALTLVIGLALLAGGGAPTAWLAVQAGAAVLALALLLPQVRQFLPRLTTVLLFAVPLALLATRFLDDGTDGVHRWLSVGPVQLHIGMLLLPALLTVHARGDNSASGVSLMACGMTIGHQPDFGMAVALAVAVVTILLVRRNQRDLMLVLAAVLAFPASWSNDPLQPVPMVEHVLTDSWQWAVWTGPLALIGALILPVTLLVQARTNPALTLPAVTLTGLWLGLLLASLIGHYPVPLLGYGASAVLGWGLALAWLLAPPVVAKRAI